MPTLLDFDYSSLTETSIHIAQSYAKEFHQKEYNAAHLLRALLHKDIGLSRLLDAVDADPFYIEEWCEVRIENLPKAAAIPDEIKGDKSIEAVFNEADTLRLKLGEDQITPAALLIALLMPGVGFSYEQLKTLPLKAEDVLHASQKKQGAKRPISTTTTSNGFSGSVSSEAAADMSILEEYCIDLSAKATAGELGQVFSREGELKMMTEILGRYTKPNVLVTGDPGVGKTVLIEGFVQKIANDSVPNSLKGAQVYALDLIHLVSGASYKSEIEDRFKKIIIALKQFDKPVLCIDELHTLTEKNSGNQGLVNILKSELVKGAVTFIATATNDGYRKHIEPDDGLSRRFERVNLDEPDHAAALDMVSNAIKEYSAHHDLDIEEETIVEAIRLSKRFNKDRSLPDSAIDLVDRTMSATRYMLETTLGQIEKIEDEIKEVSNIKEKEKKEQKLQQLFSGIKNRLSYLLFTVLKEEDTIDGLKTFPKQKKKFSEILSLLKKKAKEKKTRVIKQDVAATIANKTGIPVGKLQADEKERLLKMDEHLKRRVIGQDHAITTITEAVLESRSGLSKPGLPIGSFFFTGPTGTGKTELAKSLAEFLFQTEESIIRFDMSEFKEEHSAALLYGAPPGYVGYEEGGLLVNKIRQKPYSIVLFDEIEKAHPSVFDIFLQILDEGKLNDRLGKTGDFSNAVILFTSNIGSEHVVKSFTGGEIPRSADLMELMGRHFRPEFLGRLTEIVPFAPITKENVIKIFIIQLRDLEKALEKQDISLELSKKAQEFLAHKGFTPKYGARPLRGVIRTELRSPLSRMLITGKLDKGKVVNVGVKNNELTWNFKNK
ncbi:ATP-dependent Clp protease ATP-binding subunit [Gangjinia marincola]|uniref:ATP-dependent Clp protease ATP-binding subunit n=1 Tax=Gangjinia marincola TaxID=578463 RepID=A0ABN1MKJ4_9FLAO